MAKVYERLDQRLRDFIAAQKMFFVATAPLSAEGRVNVSPKGYDSFRILDDDTIAFLDLGGSGVETIAHLRENGRITLMWCALEGAPNILRIHGRGEALTFVHPDFPAMLAKFDGFARARAVITVKIERIADSCGWGVPLFTYAGERDQLKRSVDHRPEPEWRERRYDSNALSIDGLPGLVRPE